MQVVAVVSTLYPHFPITLAGAHVPIQPAALAQAGTYKEQCSSN